MNAPLKVQPTVSSDSRSEQELVAEALEAVREQSQREGFDLAPCMRAIELLESLPPTSEPVDQRVDLALQTLACFGNLSHLSLAYRALRSAAREGAEFRSPSTRRKWLSNFGLIEISLGHVVDGVRSLCDALELATALDDAVGESAAWANLSLVASGSGQYEDVLAWTSRAMAAAERASVGSDQAISCFPAPLINRANALHRLGRYDAAIQEAALCAAILDRSSLANTATFRTMALSIMVDGHVALGVLGLARAFSASLQEAVASPLLGTQARLCAEVALGRFEAAMGNTEGALAKVERVLTRCDDRSAYDDAAFDALHALHSIARTAGMDARADGYLTALSDRMRANAERVVAAFERNPDFAKDAVEVHRQLDGVVHGLSRVVAPTLGEASDVWRNLIGMAASATVVEESSGEHGIRVAALAVEVAEALSLPADLVQLVEKAALLHDLGKYTVPSGVLSKSGTLTEHEAFLLDRHAEDGARLIEKAPLPERSRVAEVVRLHHHPYDGVGVARQLRGDDLPIAARILAACDRFDALVTGRPRRSAVPVAEALREILRASGREFDPKVVDALIGSVRRIGEEHGDVISFLARDAEEYDYIASRRRLRRASGAAQ